jgi:hypothetical protein
MRRSLGLWVGLVLANAACADSGRECNVGADCASGACNLDGTCAPVPEGGTTREAGKDVSSTDAGSSADASSPVDGACPVNDSGTILRSQVILQSGLHATFRIAENATVSTAGETLPDGSRTWDLSGALPGDQDVLVETLPVTGNWYASAFSSATYATPLSNSSTLLGVFDTTESALLLQGVVSPEGGLTQTELTYMPAVTTLQFPLMTGATWATTSTVTGQADGVYGVYTEAYQSTADVRGTMKTPLATFEVQRVGTVLTRTVGVVVTITRSYVFVTDCYGAVAAITSQADETQTEFTSAAEVRRVAP